MTQTLWIVAAVAVVLVVVLALSFLRHNGRAEEETPPAVEPAPPAASPLAPPMATIEEAPVPTPEEAPVPIDLSGALDENDAPAPEPTEGDDLRRLKGVGPKIVALLHADGITRYAQIAAWTDADLAAIDAKLGSFAGRPTRDNWVDQARLLAAGDIAGYEAKYGKL